MILGPKSQCWATLNTSGVMYRAVSNAHAPRKWRPPRMARKFSGGTENPSSHGGPGCKTQSNSRVDSDRGHENIHCGC